MKDCDPMTVDYNPTKDFDANFLIIKGLINNNHKVEQYSQDIMDHNGHIFKD